MEYNRKQTSLEPIDILKFDTVETGAVFKQYDINTSILELELVANGEPVHLKDEKVYVTVKSSNSLSTQLLSKYSGASVKEKDNYKVLLRAKKSRRRDVNNIIDVYISPLALENSGEMIAEVMIIDLIKEERITSQSFTFEIKPSITPNRPSESAYKIVKDLDGTYITDAEDVQLLVAEVEPNFKLSFVGTRVNEILEKANNFDVEDNTNKIQALQEKDVELESKISNLEKKDSSLDGEIASLKSSDQSIEEEIQGLKAKDESIESEISQLKSKDTAIDGEIDKLKNADETIKSDINSKYEELKQKTDATNNEVMKLKSQDTTLGESIRTNKGLIDVINPKVTTLEQDSQNVKNRVSALEGDMNLAKSNISSLQSSNTELSQKVEGVEQGNASIDKIVKQLQSDVERYKSSIELLESKVPVWKDFKGKSFKVENSFYGKSRGLSIKGRTLNNLIKDGKGSFVVDKSLSEKRIYEFTPSYSLKTNKKYIVYVSIDKMENVDSGLRIYGYGGEHFKSGGYITIGRNVGICKFEWNANTFPEDVTEIDKVCLYIENSQFIIGGKATFSNFMLFEEGTDLTGVDEYFEGIKSLGEEKDNSINILSYGVNLLKDSDKEIGGVGDRGEFMKYADIAPIFDKHGLKEYTISFDLKSENISKCNTMRIYCQNGNGARYQIGQNDIEITTEFKRYSVVVSPYLDDANEKYSYLAFYGTYGTGNIPTVKNVKIEEGRVDGVPKYVPYKGSIKNIQLNIRRGLKGLNDVFDEINSDTKKTIVKLGVETFDDKGSWLSEVNKNPELVTYYYNKPICKSSTKNILCNKFVNAPTSIECGVGIYASGKPNFHVKKTDFPSLESWKSVANDLVLIYELSEPITIPFDKDTNFDTLDDVTYVSLENNIKNELSCQCQVSLASSKA